MEFKITEIFTDFFDTDRVYVEIPKEETRAMFKSAGQKMLYQGEEDEDISSGEIQFFFDKGGELIEILVFPVYERPDTCINGDDFVSNPENIWQNKDLIAAVSNALHKATGSEKVIEKMRIIWRKQLNFVKAIAEDIIANGGSREVLEHAAKYARIEAPIDFKGRSDDSSDYIRINYGEAYAYIDYNGDNTLASKISWNNDEMGISNPDCTSYEGSVRALEGISKITEFACGYEDIDASKYYLHYEKFAI